MKMNIHKGYPFREVGFAIIIVTVVVGTVSAIAGEGPRHLHYIYTFVYTTSCSIFIGFPLNALYTRMRALPRALFYFSFAGLILLGAFIGTQVAHLALYRDVFITREVLIIAIVMSFVTTIAIVAYLHIQENLADKISRIKEIELENETLRRYELEARLNSLQAKLDPHFLFNTLNSLAALVHDDPARAERNIVRLSDLYRRALSVSGETHVPIGDEIALVVDYLALEQQRFDERLSYRIYCPEELLGRKVPALLIEPLVENAVKHNASDRPLEIDLEVSESKGILHITVRDNGVGFDVAKTSYGLGLHSVQQRLALMYGERYELTIDSGVGAGTRVRIGLPCESPVTTSPPRGGKAQRGGSR